MNFCTGSRGSNLLLLSHPQSIHCSTTSTIPACEIGIINPLILLKHLHGRKNRSKNVMSSNNATISSNSSDKNSKVVMNSSSSKCFMSKDSRISKTETCKMCNRTDNRIEISRIQTDFLIIKKDSLIINKKDSQIIETDFLTTRTDSQTTRIDSPTTRTDFLTTRKDFLIIRTDSPTTRTDLTTRIGSPTTSSMAKGRTVVGAGVRSTITTPPRDLT